QRWRRTSRRPSRSQGGRPASAVSTGLGLHDVQDVVPNEREETPDVLPKLRLVGEAEVPLAHPEDEGVDLLLVPGPRIRAEAQLEHNFEEVQELGFPFGQGG